MLNLIPKLYENVQCRDNSEHFHIILGLNCIYTKSLGITLNKLKIKEPNCTLGYYS